MTKAELLKRIEAVPNLDPKVELITKDTKCVLLTVRDGCEVMDYEKLKEELRKEFDMANCSHVQFLALIGFDVVVI